MPHPSVPESGNAIGELRGMGRLIDVSYGSIERDTQHNAVLKAPHHKRMSYTVKSAPLHGPECSTVCGGTCPFAVGICSSAVSLVKMVKWPSLLSAGVSAANSSPFLPPCTTATTSEEGALTFAAPDKKATYLKVPSISQVLEVLVLRKWPRLMHKRVKHFAERFSLWDWRGVKPAICVAWNDAETRICAQVSKLRHHRALGAGLR